MIQELHRPWAAVLTGLLLGLLSTAPASAEREAVNDRYCNTCHGTDGRGNESVRAPRLAGMEPWYLQRQLENFRAGIRGSHAMDHEGDAMRAMATELSDESIADLVDWIGQWPDRAAPITLEGDASAGRALYGSCSTCHGSEAQGNPALGAPALLGQNDWYLEAQLRNFKAGYRGRHEADRYGQQMAAMVGVLTNDEDIRNVVAFIASLSARTARTSAQ